MKSKLDYLQRVVLRNTDLCRVLNQSISTFLFPARWRSIQMCQELHQDFVLQSKQKEAKFDAKGLFVHAVLTFYNEESKRCKKALEDLIKVIGREFAQKRAIESEIHHLVVDWLEAKDPVHVGLACKIMSLLIQDPVQVKTTLDVAFKRYVRTSKDQP